jgi:hypothetical protein
MLQIPAKSYPISHCPTNEELESIPLDSDRSLRTVQFAYTTRAHDPHDTELRIAVVVIERIERGKDDDHLDVYGYITKHVTRFGVAGFSDRGVPFRARRPMRNILNTDWIQHDLPL